MACPSPGGPKTTTRCRFWGHISFDVERGNKRSQSHAAYRAGRPPPPVTSNLPKLQIVRPSVQQQPDPCMVMRASSSSSFAESYRISVGFWCPPRTDGRTAGNKTQRQVSQNSEKDKGHLVVSNNRRKNSLSCLVHRRRRRRAGWFVQPGTH